MSKKVKTKEHFFINGLPAIDFIARVLEFANTWGKIKPTASNIDKYGLKIVSDYTHAMGLQWVVKTTDLRKNIKKK